MLDTIRSKTSSAHNSVLPTVSFRAQRLEKTREILVHYALPLTTHPGERRACGRDFKQLLSELGISPIEFRSHKDWCLNPIGRNVMLKTCRRAAYLVSEGEGAVLGASGTSINGRQGKEA